MVGATLREHASSILVAGLGTAFGVALLQVTGALSDAVAADDVAGSSRTVTVVLSVIGFVFATIAIYVGAIVTANTFATIVAGRARTISLLRLIGASAATQRRAIAREGLLAGVVGAVAGTVAGSAVAIAIVEWGRSSGLFSPFTPNYFHPVVLLPAGAVILTTWLASWIGSRRVLTVTPLQAIGGAQELSREDTLARPRRNGAAVTLMVIGGAILVLGLFAGLVTPFAVLIGVVGGLLSFSGLVLGAHLVMPPALRLVGRIMPGGASAHLAAQNAIRYPERSSRSTIGLVIGVTLVTMFGVAIASFREIVAAAQSAQPETYQGTNQVLDAVTLVFSILVGFSALIAAVGLVNSLSLTVLQRTRELGLLRALGFTIRQLRRMVLAEAAQLTITAVLVGLILGGIYGWVGAQTLFGSIHGSPGIVAPGIPWTVIGALVAGSVILTLIASVAPARRATRVTPVTALAAE